MTRVVAKPSFQLPVKAESLHKNGRNAGLKARTTLLARAGGQQWFRSGVFEAKG